MDDWTFIIRSHLQ